MATPIADQFDEIRRRRDELAAQQAAMAGGCVCARAGLDRFGHEVFLLDPACPVHGMQAAELATLAIDIRPRFDERRLAELRDLLARYGIRVTRAGGGGE